MQTAITMFENINLRYVTFIKSYLISRCYMDYYKYSHLQNAYAEDSEQVYWRNVFNDNHTLLKYYIELCKCASEQRIDDYEILKSHHKQSEIYAQNSFQEFIDNVIESQDLNSSAYISFANSMQDKSFKQNFIDKYDEQQIENIIKNNIIYVVRLYIIEKTGISHYMTEEEKNEIDVSLDLSPYFEYVSASQCNKETKEMKENYRNMLETKVLAHISEMLDTRI